MRPKSRDEGKHFLRGCVITGLWLQEAAKVRLWLCSKKEWVYICGPLQYLQPELRSERSRKPQAQLPPAAFLELFSDSFDAD